LALRPLIDGHSTAIVVCDHGHYVTLLFLMVSNRVTVWYFDPLGDTPVPSCNFRALRLVRTTLISAIYSCAAGGRRVLLATRGHLSRARSWFPDRRLQLWYLGIDVLASCCCVRRRDFVAGRTSSTPADRHRRRGLHGLP
jgi:hypothetical protein